MATYGLGGHGDAIEAGESALEADNELAIVYRPLSTHSAPGGGRRLRLVLSSTLFSSVLRPRGPSGTLSEHARQRGTDEAVVCYSGQGPLKRAIQGTRRATYMVVL